MNCNLCPAFGEPQSQHPFMNAFHRAFFLCLSLLFLAPARAAFNPHIVAADAQWVVYADLNGLRSSALGRELIASVQAQMPSFPPTAAGIEVDFQKLLATIGNVTAYGTNFSPKANLIDGALLIEGTGDLRKIAEGWLAQESLTPSNKIAETKDMPFPGYLI